MSNKEISKISFPMMIGSKYANKKIKLRFLSECLRGYGELNLHATETKINKY